MGLKRDRIRDLLYRSFDFPLNEKEQKKLNLALNKSKELLEEKRQIERQREAVRHSGFDYSFKPSFAENVINRITDEIKNIQRGDLFLEKLLLLFKRLSIAAAAACLLMMAYNLTKGESFQAEEAFFISQDAYEEIMEISLF